MSSVVISGNTSGAITLSAPDVSGTNTATLPAATGTVMVSGNMPAFSYYASTNAQSITSGSFTKITFTSQEFDTTSGAMFSSSRFTPTIAGYYQIDACVGFSSSALGICLVTIFKNGNRFKDGAIIPNIGGATCPASALIYFNGSTDYAEIFLYQSSGSTLTVSVNAGSAGFFQGALVRTA